jgi:hypothetical protein
MDDENSVDKDVLEKLARLAARAARHSVATAVVALASLGVSSYELLARSPFGENSQPCAISRWTRSQADLLRCPSGCT